MTRLKVDSEGKSRNSAVKLVVTSSALRLLKGKCPT